MRRWLLLSNGILSARYHARVRASALLSMPPTNRTVMLNRVTAAQSSDESDGWAAANNRIAPRHSAEAISKVEAMEAARQQAEAKAQADEEEWRQEELRLQKEEEARREAREIAEEEEERRVEEQWEAERAIALMVLDASNTGPGGRGDAKCGRVGNGGGGGSCRCRRGSGCAFSVRAGGGTRCRACCRFGGDSGAAAA